MCEHQTKISCGQSKCTTPIAKVVILESGKKVLRVSGKHHNEKHEKDFSLQELLELLKT